MATFSCGYTQNDQTVLPQQLALELVPADNPEIRDETGYESYRNIAIAPTTGHGRGETAGLAPDASGVTPAFVRSGEKGREVRTQHPAVFVLDQHGAPLQPTNPARARKLLADGRAAIARHTPFVIRLKDRSADESVVDGVEIGIDPGSKHTGIAVFTQESGERRGRYSLQLEHRGDLIRKKLAQRSAFRRGRRTRNLRYRPQRSLNRPKPSGWLPPSLQHRVDTTASWVDRLSLWAPVRAVHVERVAFDLQAISAGKPLEDAEYQPGTVRGSEVREYLLEQWSRLCAYCGVTGVPLNIDHVRPRSGGGSDRLSNLVLACVPCNQLKSNRSLDEFVTSPVALARIKSQLKPSLRDAAVMNSTRQALWRVLAARLPTHAGSGGRTKWNRSRNQLPKSHTLDALVVGELALVTEIVSTILVAACTGRGTHTRTRSDKFGFPRLQLPRQKRFFGFQTGDLARAFIPTGKCAGTHTGRVAVRSSGSFAIRTPRGLFTADRKHFRLLQRADGYAYSTHPEEGTTSTSRRAA